MQAEAAEAECVSGVGCFIAENPRSISIQCLRLTGRLGERARDWGSCDFLLQGTGSGKWLDQEEAAPVFGGLEMKLMSHKNKIVVSIMWRLSIKLFAFVHYV